MVEAEDIEPILEADLPIVDAHQHFFFWPQAREQSAAGESGDPISRTMAKMSHYLFPELMADLASGHNIRATVYMDSHTMYRSEGPLEWRSLGEVEFANGMAAMGASGLFGNSKVCAGIVGNVDLRLGGGVEEILAAHIQAGGGRYRGIRNEVAYDLNTQSFGLFSGVGANPSQLLYDERFRAGFAKLQKLDLSYDVTVLEPQLPDVIDLARAFPATRIILDHMGMPLGIGVYQGKRQERFPLWRDHMRTLAGCPNVSVKLGGAVLAGFPSDYADPRSTSAQVAEDYRPYVEVTVELFGAQRCMFESDFPPTFMRARYSVLWNAFKRLAAGCSQSEKTALFSATAARVYRLEL